MNIIIRELKANRKALIIWSVCIILFIVMGMAKFEGFSAMGEEADKLLSVYPEAIQKAFGLGTMKLTEIKGYYSIFYMYFVLIAGIHAAMLGANIISKESRDKTADFLMVKPVTRKHIITSKIIAALINIIIINLAIGITSIIYINKYNTGEPFTNTMIIIMITLFINQCIFLSMGLALSAITKSSKKASSLSTGIIVIMYMLSIARDISEKVDFVKYVTPFSYFNVKEIIRNNSVELLYVFLSLLIIIVCIIITYTKNQRKDIV
ncbi:MAG: ABC transporter permease [Vallitalea sp.]|jgi:ABC-2 type transport system permease protein|nr:ABC transporter permease [Vallitalea sp.]